ncbi:3'-5' exonuclease [Bacteroides sp.]|uniref:3'-5' exonuclease n=1 Tax=Bacteroides sp. TaxID=29523 RepID=UPI00262F271C|nr:3'-5' exonuclease [Bacteroides sp.]MDD3037949.1 3'-5' exoribonuclease [Bacteroides sp.]
MKKVIDIALDIETLSKRETAAIISIAALPFDKYDIKERPEMFPDLLVKEGGCSSLEPFYQVVNATSCALIGMHFEMDTVRFWAEQSPEAKAALLGDDIVSIGTAMESFVKYIECLKEKYDADIHIWAQGLDFDIPIVRNAIRTAINQITYPWEYSHVRCARTNILETIEQLYGLLDDPYSVLPKYEGNGCRHCAMFDAERLAFNVRYLSDLLQSKLNPIKA